MTICISTQKVLGLPLIKACLAVHRLEKVNSSHPHGIWSSLLIYKNPDILPWSSLHFEMIFFFLFLMVTLYTIFRRFSVIILAPFPKFLWHILRDILGHPFRSIFDIFWQIASHMFWHSIWCTFLHTVSLTSVLTFCRISWHFSSLSLTPCLAYSDILADIWSEIKD